MPVLLEAIIPRGKQLPQPTGIQRGVDRFLRDFALSTVREMQEYPPWRPWVRPPTSGPRKGGKRTGAYGRGWAQQIQFTSSSVSIRNPVSYAAYVGGPTDRRKGVTQARALRARGWKSVQDVAPELRKRFLPVAIRAIRGQ